MKEDPEPERGGRFKELLKRLRKQTKPVQEAQRIQEVLEEEVNPPPGMPASAPAPAADPGHRATVQLLPGRLEPLIPEVIQQEVRFQKDNSPGEQEITLGWEMGEPPHHVQLDHPSIQPLHAKMTFQQGRWMIESLVPDDPVEVNGTPVPAPSGPYLLASGDQVRIGEALFRFHFP